MNSKQNDNPKIKVSQEDLEIEFDLSYEIVDEDIEDMPFEKIRINERIEKIDSELSKRDNQKENLDSKIKKLTNTSDKTDYLIAVSSGIFAGFIDSIWVGEFSFESGKDWGSAKTNNFVLKVAKFTGFKGNDLTGAIRHLEKKYPLASDSNTSDFGGGLQHHLRDFAHHPTLSGLIFSILSQFTGKAYGTDTSGGFKIVEIQNKTFIGSNIYLKFLYGTVYWFFHLISDIAGSSSNTGIGTGLPGPLLALAKELSSIPLFKNSKIGDKSIPLVLSKLFNGTLFIQRDQQGRIIEESIKRFDFRAELGSLNEVGKQSIPVIINECLVRGFYFSRRFLEEIKVRGIKRLEDLDKVIWKNTLPWGNRTITRMLTISTSTFCLIDLGDSALRAAIKSKGNKAVFATNFLLRVNIVGIGRLSVAIKTEVSMEIDKSKKRNKRLALMSEQLHLMNAKIFYTQSNMWKSAENLLEIIGEIKNLKETTIILALESWNSNKESINRTKKYLQQIKEKDNKLFGQIKEALE